MGMVLNFLRVSNTQLNDYLQDSSLLENRVYSEESEEGEPNLMDIDKSWDGIIFLLTGQNFEAGNHPMIKAFFSNQMVDEDQDLGYGPAQYLTPEQVKELNEKLSNITTTELANKFDPQKMDEIGVYPTGWAGADMADYLTDYFQEIQRFYKEAANNNEAIITFIN